MNTTITTKANREAGDSLFSILFNDASNALSLYNAINGTNYTDEENLTITTLRDALYIGYKNDVSFVFRDQMSLYEHQSTVNPNMPLRGLIYFAELYKQMLGGDKEISRRLYRNRLIRIPMPKFYVFYNGSTNMPESWDLRLSTAYHAGAADIDYNDGDVEVVTHVLNINKGRNKELMDRCAPLNDFSEIMYRVKRNKIAGMSDEAATDAAINECIAEGIMVDFLRKERGRVRSAILHGFTDEEIREIHEMELDEAREEGARINMVSSIEKLMSKMDLSLEAACDLMDVSVDEYNRARKDSLDAAQ